MSNSPMRAGRPVHTVLGIETSCDDTSLALVKDGTLIAEATASQADLHALFGGVVPEIASREHSRLIGPLYDLLLRKAGMDAGEIDAVAVARGPGLLGSLLVGVAFAKAFALGSGVRLIGVNHLHAHLFAAALERDMALPALGLLVSGGHTHLYAIYSAADVRLLGKTLDDAAGEAFDKAGKMLGLPYPAGRHIDELARGGVAVPRLFPRPYLDNDNLDFSFSGLKTAMAQYLDTHPPIRATWRAGGEGPALPEGEAGKDLQDLCASYSSAVVDTLVIKTKRAFAHPEAAGAKTLLLAGGVAANSLLRARMRALADEAGLVFAAPATSLCTDNGAMIAYLGWRLAAEGYAHALDMEAVPRGRPFPQDMLTTAARA